MEKANWRLMLTCGCWICQMFLRLETSLISRYHLFITICSLVIFPNYRHDHTFHICIEINWSILWYSQISSVIGKICSDKDCGGLCIGEGQCQRAFLSLSSHPRSLRSFPVSNRGTPSRLPFPNLNNLGTGHFVLQNTPVQGRPIISLWPIISRTLIVLIMRAFPNSN